MTKKDSNNDLLAVMTANTPNYKKSNNDLLRELSTKLNVEPSDLSIFAKSADLSMVAWSGEYEDLLHEPDIPEPQMQADWEQDDPGHMDFIKNKPELATQYTDAMADARIALLKGANNGLAELDSSGLVPASQLPSYVDDVVEYATVSAFPVTGQAGKIYVSLATNLTYRWTGSVYVEISPSLALGETSSTAYRGDRGKTAYDHSQVTGNPHGTTKADVGLGNANNTADLDKPISNATQAALDGKFNTPAGTTAQYVRGNGTLAPFPTLPDITGLRKAETFRGTTNSSGNYTITFANAYATPPDVQPQIIGGNFNQFVRVVSISTTQAVVQVAQRSAVTLLAVEVLLAATVPVNGADVSIVVTPRS